MQCFDRVPCPHSPLSHICPPFCILKTVSFVPCLVLFHFSDFTLILAVRWWYWSGMCLCSWSRTRGSIIQQEWVVIRSYSQVLIQAHRLLGHLGTFDLTEGIREKEQWWADDWLAQLILICLDFWVCLMHGLAGADWAVGSGCVLERHDELDSSDYLRSLIRKLWFIGWTLLVRHVFGYVALTGHVGLFWLDAFIVQIGLYQGTWCWTWRIIWADWFLALTGYLDLAGYLELTSYFELFVFSRLFDSPTYFLLIYSLVWDFYIWKVIWYWLVRQIILFTIFGGKALQFNV